MKGIETTVPLPIDAAETAVRNTLAEQGFGVLTEIDVTATLRTKLGVERAPLKILGACNPNLAHRALEIDPSAALVLPCNVVLETTERGTRITAADPRELMDAPAFEELAEEASSRIRHAIDAVGITAA